MSGVLISLLAMLHTLNHIPLIPNVAYMYLHHETFSFTSWKCPWDLGSARAERAGQGEVGGWVQTAWPCLGSVVERSCWALGGPFPSFFAEMDLGRCRLHTLYTSYT